MADAADTHKQATDQLAELARIIDSYLPDETHFALIVATPNEAAQKTETGHITTMDEQDLLFVLTGHAEQVIDGAGRKNTVRRRGDA